MAGSLVNTLLVAALFVAVVGTATGNTVESTSTDSIVCICRCCYLGECAPLENASWPVSKCTDCSASRCKEVVKSSDRRVKMARIFETLQDGVPAGARAGLSVDVCEVISVLEAATCEGDGCRTSTDLKAECFDRNEPIHKYAIMAFVSVATFGVIFGFVKNHLPALQGFNAKYFNY